MPPFEATRSFGRIHGRVMRLSLEDRATRCIASAGPNHGNGIRSLAWREGRNPISPLRRGFAWIPRNRGKVGKRSEEERNVEDGERERRRENRERNSLNSAIENKRGMRRDKRLARLAPRFDLHRRLCECISMHIVHSSRMRVTVNKYLLT